MQVLTISKTSWLILLYAYDIKCQRNCDKNSQLTVFIRHLLKQISETLSLNANSWFNKVPTKK